MGNLKIPVPLAVAAWAASGLCVLTYTYLAYKETSGGEHVANSEGLAAKSSVLVAEVGELKPLERGNFHPSSPPIKRFWEGR